MYSEVVFKHFLAPKNIGKIIDPDGEAAVGDPGCGDNLELFIRVEDDIIVDLKYLVYGCASAIATSSVTSVLAIGKTIEEALKIEDEDVINELEGLPEAKYHCSNLGVTALRMAIDDYRKKK
ncbi:iron-sulfur cluster assembly scaffold protein [Helicovermis profundi]|uniref:Iron-sulfur cluster assembly scaffold protein n=1 Tax=Helicovermis profundi TaxID=3065157 RepID=A0AAU9EUA0_9FIRM|nr:iron-sulfur cluster assembly scaffold protein [Clostridia bacterium S502]